MIPQSLRAVSGAPVACNLSSRASLGRFGYRRREGSRSPESVLCIFYRIATSGLDRRTSVVDGGWVGRGPWDYAENRRS